jgi:hypothetical protein
MKAVLDMRAELGLEPALPPSAATLADEEEHEDPLSHGS